ncbi:32348_t:CDS:1 [Racocetra persica]|uniref:32348_t:CDS:1 n=1 Tax=Racocetra persica TaxID=160502 RepID=A0ACA9MAD9_9GLOM|nr:32348_t:CDS:1 [Racocetra persica]
MSSTESSDIQFALNIKHSFYEEVLRIVPPYPLTLTVEELVSPSFTSRRASQYWRNPETSKPPRPPNAYILFRKNYHAEVKQSGKHVTLKEISNLTSQKWEIQNTSVKYYFEILAEAAREKHIERYPKYKYSPKRKNKSKEISKNNIEANTGQTFPNLDLPLNGAYYIENYNTMNNENEIFIKNYNTTNNENEIFFKMLYECTYLY